MPPKSAARARRVAAEPIVSNELGVVSEQSNADVDDFSDETAWTLPQLRAWLVEHDVMLSAVESKARKSVLLDRCRARAAELQQERTAAAVVVPQPQASKIATPQAPRVQPVGTPVAAFAAPVSTPKSRQSAGTVTITPATPDDNEFQNRRASRGPVAYQQPQVSNSPMDVDMEDVSMPVVNPGVSDEDIDDLPVEPSPQYGRRVSAFGIRNTPSASAAARTPASYTPAAAAAPAPAPQSSNRRASTSGAALFQPFSQSPMHVAPAPNPYTPAAAAAPAPQSSNRRASTSGAALFQPFAQSPVPSAPTPNRRASSGLDMSYQPMNFASPAVVKTPRGSTPAPAPSPGFSQRISTSSMQELVDPFAENRTPSSVRTPRDRASLQPVDMSSNSAAASAAPSSENRRASTGSSFFGRSSAPTSHIPAQTWNESRSVIDGSAEDFDYTPPTSKTATPVLPKPSPLAASPAPVVPPSPATSSRARTQAVKEESFCDKATRKLRSFVMIAGTVLVSLLIGYVVSIWMRPIRFCNSNVDDGVVQTDCVPCPNNRPGSHVMSCVDSSVSFRLFCFLSMLFSCIISLLQIAWCAPSRIRTYRSNRCTLAYCATLALNRLLVKPCRPP
jgi:hypothetical protein